MNHEWAEHLMKDHETTERVFEAGERALAEPGDPDPVMIGKMIEYFVGYVDGCHNKKEEDHLFPLIAERGVPREGGPLAVMLQEHQLSRDLLAELRPAAEQYAAGDGSSLPKLRAVYAEYVGLLKNHFWKENDILYPMAKKVLTEADQETVLKGIEAAEAGLGPDTRANAYGMAAELAKWGQVKDLVHNLDYPTLAAILNALPVELSFVDADDTVRYFSHENLSKIFARTRGAIGMKVQNCHPQKSVHLVNRILEDFKAGRRDVAEFWIDLQGRKVHIRYWPVRSPDGEYLGCLEAVQDITPILALEGQRRLLDDA